MPAKAVYASQVLSVYINRVALDELLHAGEIVCKVNMIETPIEGGLAHLELNDVARNTILGALLGTRAEFARVRAHKKSMRRRKEA